MKKLGWAILIMAAGIVPYAAHATFLIDNGEELVIDVSVDVGTNIIMGDLTSGNGLVVTDGATFIGDIALIGFSSGSTGNYVRVTENSVFALRQGFALGANSSGNTLEVTGGSAAYSVLDFVIGDTLNADNNSVTVSGSGSELVTDGNLYVGFNGSENTLELNSGALAVSRNGLVGVGAAADNNRVEVSGGAEWIADGALFVGSATSTGNEVTVTNGGSVVLYDRLWISGTGNAFNLQSNGILTVFADFDASQTGFSYNEGASLYVGGVLSNAAPSLEGARTLGLLGPDARWNRSGSNVVVGGSSSGNVLRVQDGARVQADDVLVGSGLTVSGNTLTVTGDGAVLDIADSLSIGSVSNAGNVVEVNSGGTVLTGGALTLSGSGNAFNLGDGGWLTVSNGLDASQPGFSFLAGGSLESGGELTGLDSSVEDRRMILLNGGNAVWNLGTNGLEVGRNSSSNALYVLDGARLTGGGAVIGSAATTGSLVYISGSTWTNTEDLVVDGWLNDLIVTNAGFVSVGQALRVNNGSRLSFVGGGTAAASDYYQDAASVFVFDDVTNTPSAPAVLDVSGTAEFEGGATVEYTGTIGGLERSTVYTNRLVAADTLIVDGVTNAAGSDLEALNVVGLGSLLSIDLVSESDDLIALITRLRLAESAGFEDGTDMAAVCDEIDGLADSGDLRAENMLDTLSQVDSRAQNRNLSQLYDRHAPTYAHAKGMMDGFKQARMRGVVPGVMLPQGTLGPHFYNDPAKWWLKGYGSWGQRNDSGSFSGYDQLVYGLLGGLDKSFGEVLAGVAGGYAVSDIGQDDGDDSEAQTGYGLLYASWGTVSWFGDINLGYGRSAVEEGSGTLFDTSAEYDANQLGFYIGGGREMVYNDDRLFITPSAAFSGYYFIQESYTEKSTTAVPRRVEEFDYLSLQSAVGVKVTSMRELNRSILSPEVHVNWLHEFNADEERVGYSLVGGTGSYTFAMQAPVEDLFEVGAGLSWWMFDNQRKVFEWYAGLEGGFGDGYTAFTASLRLMSAF